MRTAVGGDIRVARMTHDLSQALVASTCGISQGYYSLIERGLAPGVRVDDLAAACNVVGLELALRTFPSGHPVRDAAHLELLSRLRALLPPGTSWRTEVPMPIQGDQRAWDAVIKLARLTIGVEAETRLRDVQAVERRLALKKRDGGTVRVILLVRASRSNLSLLRALGPELRAAFPVASSDAIAALAAGRDPGGDAVIQL